MNNLKQRLAQSDKRFAHVKNLHKKYKAANDELRLALDEAIAAEGELFKDLLGQVSPTEQDRFIRMAAALSVRMLAGNPPPGFDKAVAAKRNDLGADLSKSVARRITSQTRTRSRKYLRSE